MIYDPEHLVAFAFAESWLDREPGDRHYDQLQSGRLHFILDSLASICVRKGKGEVYAIAIQLQEHNGLGGTITLTIAGNHGVPNEVSSHLRKVWLQLQEIAQSYYTHYSNQKISIQYAEKSPPAREFMAVAKPLISQLKSSLQTLSFSKFASRVNKRYDKGTTGSRSGAPPSSRPARGRRGLRGCHTLSRVNTV